jgi:hypothetical protein
LTLPPDNATLLAVCAIGISSLYKIAHSELGDRSLVYQGTETEHSGRSSQRPLGHSRVAFLAGTRAAVGGGEKAARRIANALAKWLVGTALAQDAAREKLLADEADHAWPPNF